MNVQLNLFQSLTITIYYNITLIRQDLMPTVMREYKTLGNDRGTHTL